MSKFLGQHFLNNTSAIQKIVDAVEVSAGDTIIEIGPGEGAITAPLAKLCAERGATLGAIEKDTKLVIEIQKKIPLLAGRVEHGDALEILPKLISRLTDQPRNYKLVGNIPYYITGNLLRIIGELKHKPSKVVLMIQKEVAERVSAKPGKMNLLAAATQYWGAPEILFTLKPKDFTPPPEVSSAVISITPRLSTADRSSGNYYRFVKAAFKQPRKTLHNNLTEAFPGISRETLAAIIEQNGLKTGVRAQELSVEKLETLAQSFEAPKSA